MTKDNVIEFKKKAPFVDDPITANILNKLPKRIQAKAKEKLHQICMTPDKAEAQKHFDDFISIYELQIS